MRSSARSRVGDDVSSLRRARRCECDELPGASDLKLNPSFLRPASVAALVLLAFDCSAQPASAAPSARVAPGASAAPASPARAASSAAIDTVPGMPPVTDRANLYGDASAGKLSEAVRDAL